MRVRPLRTSSVPDLGEYLIHFTGRSGRRVNVDSSIEQLSDEERLIRILVDSNICGFETFGADASVVCLTESTKVAVQDLIRAKRYSACGLGFLKQFVFDRGGGPALYVRGDEWSTVRELPQPVRSRAVRFWPGADPEDGESLPDHLSGSSEWMHEREWRVPGQLNFGWDDIGFLVVPNVGWQSIYATWFSIWAGEECARRFESIPSVVIDSDGAIVQNEERIWA
jgi:hypothetical protein